MESDLKTTLLRSIGKVYERAENCQLTESAFQSMEAELETITNYFRVTKKQAFFIALIFALNYKGDSVERPGRLFRVQPYDPAGT